jgi:hypothetical protein
MTEVTSPTPAEPEEAVEAEPVEEETPDTGEETAASVAATNANIARTAVEAARGGRKLATQFRSLCDMLLTIRANIIVTRKDGTVGPDWEASSDLAKRHTTAVITNPILAAKIAGKEMTRDDAEYVQSNISAYYSKKEPGSEHSLRDRFIREWARESKRDIGGEPLSVEALEAVVDGEFAAFEKKSDRAKSQARQERRDLLPDVDGPEAVTETLEKAVQAVITSDAGITPLVAVVTAWKTLSKWGAAMVADPATAGSIPDKPETLEAWDGLYALVESMNDYIHDGGTAEQLDMVGAALYASVAKLTTEAKLADMLDPDGDAPETVTATEAATV